MKNCLSFISVINILLLFLGFSCKNSHPTNLNERNLIDRIIAVDTIYEIQIDSDGTYIDTVAVHRIKSNEKDIKVFSETTRYYPDSDITVTTNYYRGSGELFYSMSKKEGSSIFSIYENWGKNDEIKFAKSLVYREGKLIDSVYLKYEYETNQGKEILNIQNSKDNVIKEIYFDEMQKPSSERYMKDGDTLRHDIYIYFRGKLTALTIRNKIQRADTIRFFAPDGFYTSEKIFINDSLIKETLFERDIKGNILVKIDK